MEVSVKKYNKFVLKAYLFAAAYVPSMAYAVDPTGASNSIMGFAWRIVNGICGIVAIILVGDIAWHSRDMTEYGKRVKSGFLSLCLLGTLYAAAAWILGTASAQGTSVSGIDTAINMKP